MELYDDNRSIASALLPHGRTAANSRAGVLQQEKVRIDIGRDREGEFIDIRCHDGIVPEILDVRPAARHLVLMVREGRAKSKFLLGHDERHWFAAAAPGDNVRDVRTAIESLRPADVEGRDWMVGIAST